jgi:hypothetical protein
LFADPFDPALYMETYVVESWLARQRQLERFTVADLAIRNRVFNFHLEAAPPVVSRMVLARVPAVRRENHPPGLAGDRGQNSPRSNPSSSLDSSGRQH